MTVHGAGNSAPVGEASGELELAACGSLAEGATGAATGALAGAANGPTRGAGVARSNKRKKRNDNHWRHYWLWSLERACGVTRTTRIGPHDWYAEGAQFLLRTQRKAGNWRDPESELQATCSGLLFLSRNTPRTITPRDRDRATTPSKG